jgi:SAM-dependent methyltransferase
MQTPVYIPKTLEQYTDPREKALYDYFVKTLGWGELISARGVFNFLIEVRRFAEGKIILDAGAGLKRFAPFFDNAKQYLTVEHPSGIAMKGMEKIHYDFIAELDGEMFTSEESIDAIYCHSVLEHIEHPERFFANSLRMLTPGGRLFINVPFMYLEHEMPYDFNRFTRSGLRSRLEHAGFNIVSLLPSTNAIYGATAFVTHALRNEELARGIELSPLDLPNGETTPLIPFVSNLVTRLNKTFDEAIYDNTSPNGWLCIAEKPRNDNGSSIEIPMGNAIVITHEDDIPAALNLIKRLDNYKIYVFDPYLVDKLTVHQLSGIELVTTDNGIDYPALSKRSHSAAFEIEKELESAVKSVVPDVSILSWQHLNLFHNFLAIHWYSALWPEVLNKLAGRKIHVFVCDNPAQYYDPSFIPSLLLMQVLVTRHIDFNAFTYGKKEDYTDLVPDFFEGGGEPVRCDILAHLSTCFYDFKFFNDELDATGKTIIHMRSREWSVPIKAVKTVGLGKLADLRDKFPKTFRGKEKAFYNCIKDKLDQLLEPFIHTQSYRERQSAHIANLYKSQLAAYYVLEEYFKQKKPSQILLSDHDAGFHGPIVSFAENNGIPVLLLPHSRTTGHVEFNGSTIVSLVHPIQGENISDRNGKRIRSHKLAYPESFEGATVFPNRITKVALLLNTLAQNGVLLTRYSSFMAGVKKVCQWCKNNDIELSIRCRPHLPLLIILAEATGMELGDLKKAISVPLADFAKSCDVCLMYGAPTAGALDFLKYSIPILNPIDGDLTLHESSTVSAKIVPRGSVDSILDIMDTFVSDTTNLFDFRNTQFRDYVNSFRDAYPLRHFL